MDVLLINSNKERNPLPVLPIGLAYVARRAAESGHRVKVLDLCFSRHDFKGLTAILRREKFRVIGLSIRNLDNVDYYRPKSYLIEIKKLIELIKRQTDATIVLGGPGFSIMPLECLKYLGVHLGIKGPGEEAFCALLDSMENHGDWSKIPGLVMLAKDYHGDGKGKVQSKIDSFFVIAQQPLTLTLSPQGARELKEQKQYLIPPGGEGLKWWGGLLPSFGPSSICQWINLAPYFRYGSPVSIQTKRGCHFKCLYCSYPSIEGHGYRLRDPLEVTEEIEAMVRTTGCRDYEIVDSTFNSLEDFAKEICEAIIRKDLKVSLQASGITPAAMSRELIDLMIKAGFKSLVCSPDSGSDVMLEHLKKGFAVSKVEYAAGLFREAGFKTLWCYVLGGPGESEGTLRETFKRAQRWARPGDAIVLTMGVRIYPGTELAALAAAEGVIKDEDDLLFPKFYVSSNLDESLFLGMIEKEVRGHANYILAKDAQLSWLPYVRRASTVLGQAFPLWKFVSPINKLRNFLGSRV